MGRTVIEKIISRHAGRKARAGEIVWIDLDVRSARDFGGPNVVESYEKEFGDAPPADKAKTFFTFDCVVPAKTIPYANNQHRCRLFARKHGITIHDVDAGIGSHVMIETGLAAPGATIVGTDSHLNILGAVGAFGQGMGDTDIAFAFKSGRTWFEVPETIRVNVKGAFRPPATAKDLTLAVVGRLGASGALGMAVELYGEAVDGLDLAGRITLCSMATEMGAIIAFVAPDRRILDFCESRSGRAGLASVNADPDAKYASEIDLDVAALRPLVSLPGRPDKVKPVDEVGGPKVDSVFIGSCTNGRYEDIALAAQILKGRKVAGGVMLSVVPATKEVYGRLLEDGVVAGLFESGAIVSCPGCGGCASGQIGMTGKGEVQVSTSNRNFRGKQGDGSTYLASPLTAAFSALRGRLACD